MSVALKLTSLELPSKTMVTVDISNLRLSANSEETLITYSLGSCLGLVLYDPVVHIGGMIHCMLPLSKIDPEKAKIKPCMFVDTGVTTMLRMIYDMGAQKKNLIAKIAGAGSPLGQEKIFKIGQRNYTVARKILWKNNILIQAVDVGGACARTLMLDIATGRTSVKSGGQEVEL